MHGVHACHACRYGLLAQMSASEFKDLSADFPIQAEYGPFKDWMQRPIQLDRQGTAVREETMGDYAQCIAQFLGYVYLKPDISPRAMSLSLFSNHLLLMQWLSFCMARINATQHMTNLICKTIKVVEYLQVTEGSNDPAKVRESGIM